MKTKSKYDKINEYRMAHRMSIQALEKEIGLPLNVLRRALKKQTSRRDYHEAIIDAWMKKAGIK